MNLIVDYCKDNNCIIIKSSEGRLNSLLGLSVYITIFKECSIINDEVIINIESTEIDINKIYSDINKIFVKKLNCNISFTNQAKTLFDIAIDDSKKFELFSKKAFDIRNNNIEKRELENFINELEKNGFKRVLKFFQLLAAYHIAYSQNSCNFSVPGSGKTSTVLAAYSYLKSINDTNKHVDKLIVIGPLSSFLSWKNEYYECFNREPATLEIYGGISNSYLEKQILRSNISQEMILINYHSVNSKLELLNKLLSYNNCMIVLDEAHRIKRVENGIHSSAVLSLAPLAKSRVVLTGTPAPNGYIDFYNLYKFIWPNKDIIGYSIAQLNNMNKKSDDIRITDLSQRISPFFIRVRKKDLDLPEAIFHKPYEVEMGEIQQKIYSEIEKMTISRIEDNSLAQMFKTCALIRLRQAASNPKLLLKPILENMFNEDNEIDENCDIKLSDNIIDLINSYNKNEIPSKFKFVANIIKEKINAKEKIIIWCEFIGTCIDLSEFLIQMGIKCKLLYGGTEKNEREWIIKKFNNPMNFDFSVIIANPFAVGESISLHKGCHNALYFEQGFNAGIYMQSKDRIHRVGLVSNTKTNYYFLHSKNTLEKTIYNRVTLKEKRMIEILENEDIPLIVNNKDYINDNDDDIKAILREYYERANSL